MPRTSLIGSPCLVPRPVYRSATWELRSSLRCGAHSSVHRASCLGRCTDLPHGSCAPRCAAVLTHAESTGRRPVPSVAHAGGAGDGWPAGKGPGGRAPEGEGPAWVGPCGTGPGTGVGPRGTGPGTGVGPCGKGPGTGLGPVTGTGPVP